MEDDAEGEAIQENSIFKSSCLSYRWRNGAKIVKITATSTLLKMGVNIAELVEPKEARLESLSGKIVAIDAYNTLYQFLSIIRQPDGTPLQDSSGSVTSHLSGLIYRTTNLIEKGIRPVFVFDGKPSELKAEVIRARSERRAEASRKWEEAKVLAPEEALKYAKASSRISDTIVADAKTLLTYLGIPCVQAKTEGEAQAAYMIQRGDAELVSSQDYDCLLFGAPVMIRNLTSPRRKAQPELIAFHALAEKHGITREELVDIAILIGTDFNPGIKGIGVKKALKLIKEHHSIERLLADSAIEARAIENYELVRALFLQPEVNESYELTWGTLDEANVLEFLCEAHDFSEERVSKVLKRIAPPQKTPSAQQKSFEQWL
ncbi:MAG TPA: flap endonuclease-1 [Desulfobacteria bacterium]|nr:flap endonuclease-1 [Desulfobacteria bacterium]